MALKDIPAWEWCWMAFAAISALMHILVMVTIVRSRHRKFKNILKAPFFTIIFIEGIHELLELCTITGFNRLRKYRIIKYAVEEDNELVKWQWYWYCFMKSVLYLGHVEIALNRLSAVFLHRKFDELWNTKNIIYMNIIGYMALAGSRAVIYRTFYPDTIVTTSVANGTDLFSFNMFPENANTFESSADIALSLGTGFICILCYGATIIHQRFHGYLNLKTKKQEITMLKIGIITFLILLPTTIRSGLELWANLTDHEALRTFVSRWNMLPAEAMCMVQPWLLLISCRGLRETMFSSSTTGVSMAFTASTSHQANHS